MSTDVETTLTWAQHYAGSARQVYWRTLTELGVADPRVWCLDTDMGGIADTFGRTLPGQYVDLGIAEANLMTVGAALAADGKIPFVNTMASFAATRAAEQLKIDVAYNNLPVKVVGSHGGLAGGHFGPTHQSLEDLAITRALPNLTVIVPADAAETAKAVTAAAELAGPVYLRLGREATPLLHDDDFDFEVGRAIRLRDGDDLTLIASGPVPVHAALGAAGLLADAGVTARVLNLHTVKPLDEPAILAAAGETGLVVTVEEHNVRGGVGGAVAELLAQHHPVPMRFVGVPDVFCDRVGSQSELAAHFGISPDGVALAGLDLIRQIRG